ncbi:MAG: HAMP domain-containing histidine kinase [Oscillospiraceae bacterium]|nr:HAMP domain-containing histidine kinase [Oscillospiraceae bacterium]
MLKKLQQKFILSAMLAFALVLLALIAGINLLNTLALHHSQENMIDRILESELSEREGRKRPPLSETPWAGDGESGFTSPFFVVHCDENGQIKAFDDDSFYAVDAETVEEFTRAALAAGKERGTYKSFRYRVAEAEDGRTLVFLNVSDAVGNQRRLLLVSLSVAAVSLCCAFALVIPLSRSAMRPYLENIKRQKQFITDAGHELKTPITSISTSADIAAMEYEDDEWIANIQKQTQRLSKLVTDLVTLSRLDEELPFPEQESFSLSEACAETAESFQPRAKAEGKRYSVEIQDDLTLYGDRGAVQQMLSILLDNALKYSDRDGEVSLRLSQKHGRAVIEVRNTCSSPLPEDPERLFDRFYRPDESRSTRTGGTGLGLSIARAIAESHKGSLTAGTPEPGAILFRATL